MEARTRHFLSGFVAAFTAYVFVSLAFTGQLYFLRLAVVAVWFVAVALVFDRFVAWAETLESE